MRRLKLRFPPEEEARGAGYFLVLLGAVALVGVLHQFRSAMDEVAYWELRIASMDRRVQRKTTPRIWSAQGGREIKNELKKANAVMSEIDLPWESLFDSVEHAASQEVALLSFQPDVFSRTVRIGGEAKNTWAMLDFVSALERQSAVKDAYLLKYEVKRDDPQRPVVFFLTASWT